MVQRARSGAGSDTWDVRARTILLAASNADSRPFPASAGAARAAGDYDVMSRARDSSFTLDVAQGKAGNRDTAGSRSVQITAVVVLFDQNAVLGNARHGQVRVRDVVDLSGLSRKRLDADGLSALRDLIVRERDGVHGVVLAASYATDRQAVTTRAKTVLESDMGTGVDCDTVVLIVDLCAVDDDVIGTSNVKPVGIVGHSLFACIPGRIVDGHPGNGQTVA